MFSKNAKICESRIRKTRDCTTETQRKNIFKLLIPDLRYYLRAFSAPLVFLRWDNLLLYFWASFVFVFLIRILPMKTLGMQTKGVTHTLDINNG